MLSLMYSIKHVRKCSNFLQTSGRLKQRDDFVNHLVRLTLPSELNQRSYQQRFSYLGKQSLHAFVCSWALGNHSRYKMLTAAKRVRAALSAFCRELLLCPLKSMWPLPGVTKARLTLDQGGHLSRSAYQLLVKLKLSILNNQL